MTRFLLECFCKTRTSYDCWLHRYRRYRLEDL